MTDPADRVSNAPQRVVADGWFADIRGLLPLGEGHINDTLLVTDGSGDRFVLQRINDQVFRDPALVMNNLVRVIELLQSRAPGFIPALVSTRHGEPAWVDEAGGWWRLWRYVEGTRARSSTRDPAIARSAGEAFGRFQYLLQALPEPRLTPTIPGFLELTGYLEQLDRQLIGDLPGDVSSAVGNGAFIDSHRKLADRFPGGSDYLHGDCKLNNLLFQATGAEVAAVVDLDTVMCGHWAWDFGDLARSVLQGGGEMRSLFAAVVAGFALGSRRALDVEALLQAPVYVAFMLGVRFLTDHLAGDRYFKVNARGDNLRRAEQQFDLVRHLEGCARTLHDAAVAGLREAEAIRLQIRQDGK